MADEDRGSGMSDSLSPDPALVGRLRDLTKKEGIYRNDFRDFLSPQLRKAWGIARADDTMVAREKVKAGIEGLLDELSYRDQVIAKIAYNVGDLVPKEYEKKDREARFNWWCTPEGMERSSVRKPINEKTVQNYHLTPIITALASTIQREFPAPLASAVPSKAEVAEIEQPAPAPPQPDQAKSELPPTPELKQRVWARRHPYLTGGAVVVVVVGLLLLLVPQTRLWELVSASPQSASKPPQKLAAHTPPATSSSDPVTYQPGNAIKFVLNAMVGKGNGSSLAFPTDKASEAATYINEFNGAAVNQAYGEYGGIFAGAMKAGAYSFGQLVLPMQFISQNGQSIQIFKIRALTQSSAAVATGAVIIEPGGSGQTNWIGFDLDDQTPMAKFETNGVLSTKPYFDSQTIDVKPDDPDPKYVFLDFHSEALSHTFEVALDYDTGGKRYTEILGDNTGNPFIFRVTGTLCDSPSTLDTAAQQQFRQKTYSSVYEPDTDVNGNVVLRPGDPAAFVAGGCNL